MYKRSMPFPHRKIYSFSFLSIPCLTILSSTVYSDVFNLSSYRIILVVIDHFLFIYNFESYEFQRSTFLFFVN